MTDLPIDRGWAWACVIGSNLSNLFLIGGYKSLGILVVEFTDAFDAPLAATTVMLGLIAGFMSLLSPLGTAMGERYTNRVVVVTGGIFMALGPFITSFAVSMTYVILTFGIFSGIGYGCVFGPSNVVIGHYFRKKRSLASGIAVAGGSVGQLLIPLILTKLIDTYSWRGALLIYSAIILHVVVGAMLFRPLSFYGKKPATLCQERNTTIENTHAKAEDISPAKKMITNNSKCNVEMNNCNNIPDEEESNCMMQSVTTLTSVENYNNGDLIFDESDNTFDNCSRGKHFQLSNGSLNLFDQKLNLADSVDGLGNQYSNAQYSSSGSLCFVPFAADEEDANCIQRYPLGETPVSGEEKASFIDVLKVSFCGFCIKKGSISKKESLFDWSLFRNRLFLMYILGMAAGNTGFVNLYMFIPKLSGDLGYGRQQAALLLSIGGFCDLFSRVVGGWFADLGYIKRHNIVSITILVIGISSFIFPHIPYYPALIVYVSIVGIMGGFYASLFLVVLIDLIGLERTPKAFGMTLMIVGFVNMPMPILLGYLRDVTGVCWPSFTVCATLMTICCFIFGSEPLVRKWEERRQEALNSER